MKKIRGTFLSIPVLLLANAPALWKLININSLLKTLIIILFALYTLVFMFKSHGRKGSHGKSDGLIPERLYLAAVFCKALYSL